MDVADFIRSRGGIVERGELTAQGFSSYAIGAARHGGEVFRVRRAWYAHPTASPEIVRAVRVGGALSCVSRLRSRGVWLPSDDRVHVAVPRTASRLRSSESNQVRLREDPQGVVVHWAPEGVRPEPPVDAIAPALAHATTCLPVEFAVAAIDSAMQLGAVDRRDLDAAFARFPARSRALLRLVDSGSQSGLETVARLRLRALGVRYRTQVQIAGVGRVDMLIGRRLVLELDGRAFHATGESFEIDRRRTLELQRRGYLVTRLSYRQVLHDWDSTCASLLHILRRGDHRPPPRLQDQGRAVPDGAATGL